MLLLQLVAALALGALHLQTGAAPTQGGLHPPAAGPPAAECLLPKANDNRCCKPGSVHHGFNRPCDDPGFAASHAFCNASLNHAARIQDVISRMSIEEKIHNLGIASRINSSGLDVYSFWSEGTHGVAGGGSVARSQFAMPITTSQAFNRSLWRATGAQIGPFAKSWH